MLQAIGFTSSGIAAGSLASTFQSVAAGGAMAGTVGAAATGAGVLIGFMATGGGAAAMVSAYKHDQTHTLGDSDSREQLQVAKNQDGYVLVWENWIHGQFFRCFENYQEALELSNGGRGLRRMIVQLSQDPVENEHEQTNYWTEMHFDGTNTPTDNTLRAFLANLL